MVSISPWPILISLNLFFVVISIIKMLKNNSFYLLLFMMILLLSLMYQWFRDINRESLFQGMHSMKVKNGLKLGMMLFIISEIFFFMSFFWAFFHSCLSPNIELGMLWPPLNIIPINPLKIPLSNSILLVSSGATLTLSHYLILNNNKYMSEIYMKISIILGLLFCKWQMYEWNYMNFSMNDSIYGSTFYLLTGFHSLHVIIGLMMLSFSLISMKNFYFSKNFHLNFEFSTWYWHFVDMIWLFLYLFIYWFFY
uniref:Cytochrome c oxidase subunit 3 n=1 Tax=Ismarus sp. ZJUH_2016020 TaxID=2491162 RepID=A0A3Q8UA43_9HYME|nr:cytochrome c oxidase subunit 3 [Ismarus sp. ZJUH_2016020]